MADNFEASIALRRAESLTALVQRELERMIVDGTLIAGTRLNEQALAARFGVSRGPVREAMRALERANLVSTRLNQGFFVREPTVAEIREVYNVRAVVYGYICGELARTIRKEDLVELAHLIESMGRAISDGDAEEYFRLNIAFHEATLEQARNDCATRTYRSLINESHLARRRALDVRERMQESDREHRELLEAIRRGDVTLARKLGEDHVVSGRQRWEATLSAPV